MAVYIQFDAGDPLCSASRLLFTVPWEPLVVQQSDALGLRALTGPPAAAGAPG
jgi:hypothetical protein